MNLHQLVVIQTDEDLVWDYCQARHHPLEWRRVTHDYFEYRTDSTDRWLPFDIDAIHQYVDIARNWDSHGRSAGYL